MTTTFTPGGPTGPTIFAPAAGENPWPAVEAVLASLSPDDFLAVDVETTGLEWDDLMRLMQLGGPMASVVLNASDPTHREAVAKALHRWIDAGGKTTAHNADFDALHLHRAGVIDYRKLLAATEDTYLLSGLVESPASSSQKGGGGALGDPRGLKALTSDWLPHSYSSDADDAMHADWKRQKWSKSAGWKNVDIRDPFYLVYSGCDVIDASRLAATLYPAARAAAGEVADTVLDQEREMLAAAAGMQLRGHRVDLAAIAADEVARRDEVIRLAAVVTDLGITNPNSTPQVRAALEAEIGHEVEKVDQPTLKQLPDSRVAQAVLAYRKVAKASGTYTTAWPRLARVDGKLHPSINTLKAATGRFAMSNPNLQNVPGDLRRYVIPDEGHTLISVDASAIEVRVGGALAGDAALRRDLEAGLDPYTEVAKATYEVDVPTKEQRNSVKPVLLGRMYGRGPKSLAKQRVSEDPTRDFDAETRHAENVMQGIDKRYPQLKQASYALAGRIKLGNSRIVLPSGRPLSVDPTYARVGFNALVQGAAREILVTAGISLMRAGYAENLWLCIHDEWVLQVPDSDVETAKAAMEQAMTMSFLGVPITAEATVLGKHWRKA